MCVCVCVCVCTHVYITCTKHTHTYRDTFIQVHFIQIETYTSIYSKFSPKQTLMGPRKQSIFEGVQFAQVGTKLKFSYHCYGNMILCLILREFLLINGYVILYITYARTHTHNRVPNPVPTNFTAKGCLCYAYPYFMCCFIQLFVFL